MQQTTAINKNIEVDTSAAQAIIRQIEADAEA